MACLAFPLPFSSFLLPFFFLFSFFRGVFRFLKCVCGVEPRGLERKERTRLGCFLLLQRKCFLSLFLGCLAEHFNREENVFAFYFSFFLLVLLQNPIHINYTSPPSHYSCPCYHILSPF